MEESNRLVIDLGDVKLTDKQMKSLQDAIHKVVSQKVKKAKPPRIRTRGMRSIDPGEIAGATASLAIEFHNVDAGLSNLTATHNGNSQSVTESGNISFDHVKPGESIVIKGDSAGSKTVTLSGVKAVPMQMNFAEGQHINGIFLIIS